MSGTRVTKFQWQIDLVDKASKKMLANDRQVRRSIEQTGREYDKQARTAERAGGATIAAARKVGQAARQQGRAAAMAGHDINGLAASQRAQIRASEHAVTVSNRLTQQYRRQATAAREAARAEQSRASAMSASAKRGVAAGAAGAAMVGGVAATAGTAGAVAGIRVFADFEQQMSRVAAVSDATGKQMSALTKQALDLGNTTSFSAREAAAGMTELATSGFKVNEIMGAMSGTVGLAAASGAELAQSAQIQAAQLRAFELPATKAGHVADVLAMAANKSAVTLDDLGESLAYISPVAGRFNQSFEDMAAAVAIVGNVGIKGSMAGTAIRRGLVSVVKPTEKTLATLKAAGISSKEFAQITTDSMGRLRPMPKMLGGLATALKGVDGATRRRTIAQIFGTEALPGMLTLFEKGEREINSMSGAMKRADGTAAKAAKTMRDNVSGAWDQFTGSVETAAITLTTKFAPAIKNALKGGSGQISRVTTGIAAGLAGQQVQPARKITRDGQGRVTGVEMAAPSRTTEIASKVGGAIRKVASAAVGIGKKLVDAFKPAMPFLQNVLLPLFKGLAKGVIGAVVMTLPIIKLFATALGWIGQKAKPLKGVFEKIGMVIGFVFAGPILKLLGFLPKVGIVFRVFGGIIGGVGKVFGVLGRGILKGIGFLARINPAVIAVKLVVHKVPVWIATVIGKAASAAKSLAKGILRGLDGIKAAPGKVLGFIRDIPGKAWGAMKYIAGFFTRMGKRIVDAIVGGIKSAPGAIKDAVTGVVTGAVKGAGTVIKPWTWRTGGVVPKPTQMRRYQGGGLVDAMVSSGEDVYMPGGGVWTVPGPRVAADNVHARLPAGAAVVTGHGQQLLAGGASMPEVLSRQLPHFAGGGVVRGRVSVFGPPSEGAGKTATGVSSSEPGVAIRPGATFQTGRPTLGKFWRIRIGGHEAVLKQTDLGPHQWTGRRIDVTGAGARKMGLNPSTFPTDKIGTATPVSGSGSQAGGTSDAIMLKASRRRAGLVTDALSQGLEAGRSGLTRSMIRAANRGARGATANPLLAAIRSAWTATVRKKETSSPSTTNSTELGGASGTLKAAMASARRSGLTITSTTGGKHAKNSWHYKGRAFDASNGSGPTPQMMSFAKRMASRYGRNLKELFYNPLGWYIKNGQKLSGPGPKDHSNHVHVAMRRGGLIPRFRKGGVPKIPASGALEKVDEIVGSAANMTLERLRRQVLAGVRAGGTKAVVQRLQAVLSLIDGEIGRRIGLRLNQIDAMTSNMESRRGQSERWLRRRGIDPGSTTGIATDLQFGEVDIAVKRKARSLAKGALTIAKRTKDPATIQTAQEALDKAAEDLDEAITQRVEKRRDLIRQTAQEIADSAQFGVDLTNGGLSLLDAQQRVNGSSGTPNGLIQRSNVIRDVLLPALTGQRAAAIGQQAAALKTGDLAGFRSATLAIQQASTDIATAMADAADLVKQAALDAAQATVDVAQHGTSMQQLQLTRIELEQRLQGVYDGGGQTRADFINTNLLPALQGELTALRNQAAQAQEQGDSQLARQIAEAIAGKQNDVLQAQLDAMEQVAENTDQRNIGGGSLAFSYGGSAFTDQIINAGTGA